MKTYLPPGANRRMRLAVIALCLGLATACAAASLLAPGAHP
jgi:hypothetical protein